MLPGVEVLAELGRGAHSVVYRVHRTGPDGEQGEYALKILDRAETDTTDTLVAFRREAALLASIAHPGLTRIHEIGESQGRPYLVMDLLDGTPLAELLTGGALPVPRVLDLALEVVGPLAAVHRKGLVHRDLKPHNIMVLPDGAARLIDFGLATHTGDGESSSAARLAAVGTLAYAPPEQSGMLKRPVDQRSDLYSLGVVLFECLAGRLPFTSSDVGELLRMHAVTRPDDLATLVPGVSATLAGVVATLLAKDPDDRYQSGDDLAADLRRLRADPDAQFAPGARAPGAHRVAVEPLCGRGSELAALTTVWHNARNGRGGVCLLHGSSGAGKSRLAIEVAAIARDGACLALHGGSSLGDEVPFAPLRDAVEGYLLDLAGLSEGPRAQAYERVRSAAGAAASLLAALSPDLAALLGAPVLASDDHHDQFAVAVADFFADLAIASGGLVLQLDDVQWLDDGTSRVLSRLADRLGKVPLLVLATARDDEASVPTVDALAAALGRAVLLDVVVGPLDEEGVEGLVRANLPGIGAGSTLPRLLTSRANGHPLVILEYLRAIVDAGLLRPSWGSWVLDEASLGELELPSDALGLVLTRMDRLRPQVRELLRTAAAMGPRFRTEELAVICGTEPGVVLVALAEAARRRVVEPRDGGEYAFLHDRFREALLDPLDADVVAGLHRHIAEVLDVLPTPDGARAGERIYVLARHFGLGGTPRDPERAFAAFRDAGRLALTDQAPAQAVALLEQAAGVGGSADPEFLVLLATALNRAGRFPQARERLEQALELEQVPLRRGATFALLAGVHRATWDITSSMQAVLRGLAAVGAPLPARPAVLMASSLWMFVRGLAMMLTRIGFGAVRGAERERVELIATLQSEATYLSSANLNLNDVMVFNFRNLYWSARLGGGVQFVRAMGFLAFPFDQLGLKGAAERAFRAAEREAIRMGDPHMTAETAWNRGAVTYLGKDGDDGAGWALALEEHGRWLNTGEYCDGAISLCWEAAVSGRTTEMLLWADRIRHRLSSIGETEITSALTVELIVAIVTGQVGKAGAEMRRLTGLLDGYGGPSMQVNMHVENVLALLEQGSHGQRLEDAASFFAAGLSPAMMIRNYRSIFVHHAFGRLARCRDAADDELPAQLAAARAAVRRLHRMANNPLLRAFEQVARADLLLLDDAPECALEMLGRMKPLRSDSPMVAFEVARGRARASRALGHREEAERQARAASAIAVDQGWPHRARWIAEEFGIAQDTSAGSRTGVDGTSATVANAGIDSQRLRALEQVSNAASRVLDPDALIRIALDETIRILAADRAFLFLTTHESPTGAETAEERLVPHLGRDAAGSDVAELTGYSASLVQRVWASGEVLVVTGTEQGAALGAQSVVLYGLRSIMVAPLKLEGRTLGVIYLDSQVAKGIFMADDAGILTALTNHIATSLETARAAQLELSVQTAQQQRDLAEQLHDALGLMTGTLDPAELLGHLLAATTRLVPCDGSWLLLADADADAGSDAAAADDALAAIIDAGVPLVGGPGPVPSAAFTGPFASVGEVASWIALPLVARTARLGVLLLASRRPLAFGATQEGVAGAVVAQGMTAYDNASLFARVQELAVSDELTGISNRRHFFEVAERDVAKARRSGRPLVVVMADIDHFKRVNDTYGHPTGDDVIRVVASRLAAEIRATDLLGRYGGEEFALVLLDAAVGSDLPERLRQAIGDVPIQTRSGPLDITVSIGMTRLLPDDVDIAAPLARADQGLYEAKRNGRNQVQSA